jgi:CRISPR/Cas system-associated endonuclease/helicase Cas3
MSDDITVNETTVEPTDEVAIPEPQGEPESTDWKAEARKWEKRAKDANADKELANKWREYEAAQKPAQERMAEELATTKAEAESARTALLRYEVASEKNIPTEALRLLTGSTREELEENADALIALIATQSKPKTPTPDASQGRPATEKPGQLTKEDLANMSPSEIMEAKRAGRLSDVLGQ